MADQTSTPVPFTPKQMYPKTAALYNELTGNSSIDVAKHIVTKLLPPFTADAVIHDNGCGTGEVTSQIMETNPPPPSGIIIKSTDKNQYMIDGCRERATAGGWPVEAIVMPAQSLTFPDEYFSHSFTNFIITHLEENHDPAAKHIYRTVKKGGVAVVSTWAAMAHGEPIKKAHLVTRGPDVVFPMGMPNRWYEQSTLKEFLLVGGFKEENIKISTCDVYIETKDLHHLMTATWSFLGSRADGWHKSDEENWDKAVDVLVKEIEAGPYYHKTPSGDVALRMVANVAIATK